jgi:hypothetical protein
MQTYASNPKTVLALALAAVAAGAHADITHGPNPYAPGLGFDAPNEAAWGGWSRGEPGTLYAEWDTFIDRTHAGPNDRTSAPDRGKANLRDGWMGWGIGNFTAGSGNLYSFTQDPQRFRPTVVGSTAPGPLKVALQIETWGNTLLSPGEPIIGTDGKVKPYAGANTVFLNGQAPTSLERTYSKPDQPTSFGSMPLYQYLALWDLPQAAANDRYDFAFDTKIHTALAQVAIDIGPLARAPTLPQPPAVIPLPPAVALLASALASMGLIGRRRALPAGPVAS